MFCDCCSDSRKSSMLVFKTDSCSFWRGETEYESWKFYGYREASMFWNCRSASYMTSILFSNSDFSSIDYSGKEVYEAWCWEIFEDCKSSMFGNRCWDSSMTSMASIFFSNSYFSSIGGFEKGVYEAKLRNEYCGQGDWKLDSREMNPHRLCEELKLFWDLWS